MPLENKYIPAPFKGVNDVVTPDRLPEGYAYSAVDVMIEGNEIVGRPTHTEHGNVYVNKNKPGSFQGLVTYDRNLNATQWWVVNGSSGLKISSDLITWTDITTVEARTFWIGDNTVYYIPGDSDEVRAYTYIDTVYATGATLSGWYDIECHRRPDGASYTATHLAFSAGTGYYLVSNGLVQRVDDNQNILGSSYDSRYRKILKENTTGVVVVAMAESDDNFGYVYTDVTTLTIGSSAVNFVFQDGFPFNAIDIVYVPSVGYAVLVAEISSGVISKLVLKTYDTSFNMNQTIDITPASFSISDFGTEAKPFAATLSAYSEGGTTGLFVVANASNASSDDSVIAINYKYDSGTELYTLNAYLVQSAFYRISQKNISDTLLVSGYAHTWVNTDEGIVHFRAKQTASPVVEYVGFYDFVLSEFIAKRDDINSFYYTKSGSVYFSSYSDNPMFSGAPLSIEELSIVSFSPGSNVYRVSFESKHAFSPLSEQDYTGGNTVSGKFLGTYPWEKVHIWSKGSDGDWYLAGTIDLVNGEVGGDGRISIELDTSNLLSWYDYHGYTVEEAKTPQIFNVAYVYNNRLFAGAISNSYHAGALNNLSWSNIGKLGFVPANRYINTEFSGKIEMLHVYKDLLFVISDDGIATYDVRSFNPEDWSIAFKFDNIKPKVRDGSFVSTPEGLFFAASDGVYWFDRGQEVSLQNISKEVVDLAPEHLAYSVDKKFLFVLGYPKLYYFDVYHKAWFKISNTYYDFSSLHTAHATAYGMSSLSTVVELFGGGTAGELFFPLVGFRTNLGNPFAKKRFIEARVDGELNLGKQSLIVVDPDNAAYPYYINPSNTKHFFLKNKAVDISISLYITKLRGVDLRYESLPEEDFR